MALAGEGRGWSRTAWAKQRRAETEAGDSDPPESRPKKADARFATGDLAVLKWMQLQNSCQIPSRRLQHNSTHSLVR